MKNADGIPTPKFKTYNGAILIKVVWSWHKTRYVDEWNKIEYPNTSTGNYSHLMFDKDAKTFAWQRKKSSKYSVRKTVWPCAEEWD